MKKLRVLMVVHYSLVPPDDLHDKNDPRMEKFRTEYDTKTALLTIGHEVQVVGVYDDLAPIRQVIEEWKPHIAFNLLEDFAGNSAFDYYVVSYFEMMHLPHTGCNPRGLLLARDKALSKMILTYHRISVPDFVVFPLGKKISRLRKFKYPLVVKSLMEEGSVGIAKASYVENDTQLRERVALIHDKLRGDAIAEEYIDGRELYVTLLGNNNLEVLPIRELDFGGTEPGTPRMATYKVKWDDKYRERWKIEYLFARNLPDSLVERINHLCKRVYHLLDMNGYGRIDLRLTVAGGIYVLEANPNPGIARDEDCSLSAIKSGLSYEDFIQRLVHLGLTARSIE
ncbi:MAG: D-alanine--D-alanine ligase family protein [Sulfuricaulis sp.]